MIKPELRELNLGLYNLLPVSLLFLSSFQVSGLALICCRISLLEGAWQERVVDVFGLYGDNTEHPTSLLWPDKPRLADYSAHNQ